MRLKLLIWNVRGLNDKGKRAVVRSLLKSARADVMCLQETKMECVGVDVVRDIWGGWHVDWAFQPAIGAAGGVLMCWDNRVFSYLVCSDVWMMTFFGYLRRCMGWSGDRSGWFFERSGDFNVVQSLEKKTGVRRVTGPMKAFSSFIDRMELIDMPYREGGIGKSIFPRCSRLDYSVRFRIIGLSYWIVGECGVARHLFVLRICGYRPKVLARQ
ncbi:hypothetical protein CsSME_00050757 [Camellia sinensis var. sinensis]